jgi:hypothetical protein
MHEFKMRLLLMKLLILEMEDDETGKSLSCDDEEDNELKADNFEGRNKTRQSDYCVNDFNLRLKTSGFPSR